MRINMRDVVNYNGVPLFNESPAAADTVCPICGRRKLHFDFRKNVFNCPACGEAHGGVLDAWALYRDIEGTDKSDLYRNTKFDIENFFSVSNPQPKPRKIDTVPEVREEKLAPVSVRNNAFRRLLEELSLNPRHRENLRGRGFTDAEIEYFGFKSMPETERGLFSVAEKLTKEGCSLRGIPGFYIKGIRPALVSYGSGILIPERNGKGEILECQIRKDNVKEGGTRYLTLSSANKEGGTKGKAVCHFAGEYGENKGRLQRIILTEGPIKADYTFARLGIPTISVPGVTSTAHFKRIVPELIRSGGLEKVLIAYDMDSITNPYVQKALQKIKDFLYESDLDFEVLTWDPAFKGIDDYLKENYK